jgi:hypothetical protein
MTRTSHRTDQTSISTQPPSTSRSTPCCATSTLRNRARKQRHSLGSAYRVCTAPPYRGGSGFDRPGAFAVWASPATTNSGSEGFTTRMCPARRSHGRPSRRPIGVTAGRSIPPPAPAPESQRQRSTRRRGSWRRERSTRSRSWSRRATRSPVTAGTLEWASRERGGRTSRNPVTDARHIGIASLER